MNRSSSPASVAAACGLIVVTNAALLAAAGWNRRGEPQAELSLTERELALPAARQDEGTGLELSLLTSQDPPGVMLRAARWKRRDPPPVELDWLDRSKLHELGFRVDVDPTDPDAVDHYSHAIPRRAYVVLEYEGEAWNRWIADREAEVGELRRKAGEGAAEPGALADAEAVLALDRTMRSRLFPVDAGTDAGALRRRYDDRRRYAVVAGLLRPKVVHPDDEAPFLTGDVMGALVRRLHVPRELRQPLEEFLPEETWSQVDARERRVAASGWPSPVRPRYEAVLAVGRAHEPWLVGVGRAARD